MTVKITISVDEQVKRTLSVLARKNKKTVSGFISDMVRREGIRGHIPVADSGLGTRLLPDDPIVLEDKDYKRTLAKLREEKYLR